MGDSRYRLAQINIARLVAPLTDPAMADFVANLAPINALAEASPGFVWRFQTEQGDATAIRPYDDDRIIINFSVWDDLSSLRDFVFRSAHAAVMKRRRKWFERLTDEYIALWWVLADHRPTVPEAVARIEHLKRHGPSPEAFTFRESYPAPDRMASIPSSDQSRKTPRSNSQQRIGDQAETSLQLRHVGIIRSRLTMRSKAPRQGVEGAPDAWLEVDESLGEALDGVAAGDRIIVITWLHQAQRDVLKVHPRDDERRPLAGVFATRSPDRPNPIGLHPVTVKRVVGTRLRIGPIEAVDGTPVIDIKPILRDDGG